MTITFLKKFKVSSNDATLPAMQGETYWLLGNLLAKIHEELVIGVMTQANQRNKFFGPTSAALQFNAQILRACLPCCCLCIVEPLLWSVAFTKSTRLNIFFTHYGFYFNGLKSWQVSLVLVCIVLTFTRLFFIGCPKMCRYFHGITCIDTFMNISDAPKTRTLGARKYMHTLYFNWSFIAQTLYLARKVRRIFLH